MFEVDKIEYNFCFLWFGYILCSIKVIMFCCCLNRLMNVVVLVHCISVVDSSIFISVLYFAGIQRVSERLLSFPVFDIFGF